MDVEPLPHDGELIGFGKREPVEPLPDGLARDGFRIVRTQVELVRNEAGRGDFFVALLQLFLKVRRKLFA